MPHLMHIGFDNSSRLCRNVYYFEYKNIQYKLIQNNMRKWCDVLITIVEDDRQLQNQAYIVASEFLSALSWQNHSSVKLRPLGGMSVPHNYNLRKTNCRCFGFPEIPFGRDSLGYDICQIPEIENEEQRTALILFREALSSNNDYLSFLFYWQILEIKSGDPIGWVNKVYRNKLSRYSILKEDFSALPIKDKNLGNYLYDDCRNAIAHIKRKPGKIKLKLDTPDDNMRISASTSVVKEFASYYIRKELGLSNKMYLIKNIHHKFPVFVTEKYIKKVPCAIAYDRLSPAQVMKKS